LSLERADGALDLAACLRLHAGEMSESPVKAGEVLAGKYRVERVLGMGAMGVVVAATHLGLGQLVALKFMLQTRAPQREQTERFLREAKVAVKLRSQHSARVLDVGVLDSGAPYMVMELLEGRDLAALLASGATIAVEDAVEYLLQVCEAIGEAHASGIVHRDLKPANLFLTTDAGGEPCVKVLDFGVSKLTGSELQLTGTVQALGSPLYMSPEQMQAARDVDGRSDIWALGAVLFELLARTTPFHAESLPELCTKVFYGEPLPLASLRPDVPAALIGVILGCLEKDRARRFQNVAALAAALAPFATPRARVYADRVASVQGVEVVPSRPTDVLPPAPDPLRARSAPSLISLPAIAETAAVASSLPIAAPPRRWGGLLVLAISLGIITPIAAYLGLRSRAVDASSVAAPLPSSAASVSSAEPAVSVEPAASTAPSATEPVVATAPSATATASARITAPAVSVRRAPSGAPTVKDQRPGYEGPRR
jgi:serine/threonine protein kinase